MKIITLNPPYFPMFSRASRSPAVTKSSTLYYPFFLAYATGVLESDGFDVAFIDAPAAKLDKPATLERIKAFKPDLVICETSTPSIENDMEVVKDIKSSGVPFVIAVGTHVSALAQEVLEKNLFLDAVARREYEYTVRDLARRLDAEGMKANLAGIEGISFRQDGNISHNPGRPPIENLDELPFVSRIYRKHLRSHINSYFYGANLHPVISILSGRGCPHKCAYCLYPQTMTGNHYRLRSVSNLIEELEFIKKEFLEIREVFLEDDTFTVDHRRAREISQEIIDRKLKITWSTNSRADVDFETMKVMHQAGCRLLCVGFESASQQIVDKIGKQADCRQYFKFRKDAKRAGLLLHGCFMYGNEGETPQTMRQTLELAKLINCDTSQFYPIMVYPGTKAYDDYKKRGYLKAQLYRDWLTQEGFHNCVVSLPNISNDQLVAFCDLSRREFYLRSRHIIPKAIQLVTKPKEAKRTLRAFSVFIKHLFRPF